MVAKKKNNSKALFIVIIAILLFFILKDKVSFGGVSGDKCGDKRVADEERSGYCSLLSSDYDALAIVVGNTANTPMPDLDFTSGKMGEILDGVFYNTPAKGNPSISLISVAGNGTHSIPFKNYRPAKNLNASSSNLKKLAKEINNAIKTSPENAGADYYAAILAASEELRDSDAERPVIIVVGSGYSDRGVLDFTSGDILSRSAEDLAQTNRSLKKDALDGISIKWERMGGVASPQGEVGSNYITATKDFYSEILDYLGAKYEISTAKPTKNEKSVDTNHEVGQIWVNKLTIGDTLSLDETVGKFIEDSAEFVDSSEEERVRLKLKSFASQFDMAAGYRLKVTGYINVTGSCVEGSISLPRAQKIKSMLVTLGVPEDRIEAVGCPGSPSISGNEYECNCPLSAEECRTVKVEVIK